MPWDPVHAYQAVQARDARFDGRLYVGVTSTGVYCRPICRVRLPKPQNCRYFSYAAQAEDAGFRPCLKCRPELAPGGEPLWSVMHASQTLALQAAHLMDLSLMPDAQPLQTRSSVSECARRLGITDRHLRRIFSRHYGVSPMQYMQTRRLLLAKQLLTDSQLSVSQVALCSGFQSLRRFNAAFAQAYRMNPSALRRQSAQPHARVQRPGPSGDTPAVTLHLGYRPPYDEQGTLQFYAARALTGVEAVDLRARVVRRTLRLDDAPTPEGWLKVQFVPERQRVLASFPLHWASHCTAMTALVRRWLDLDAQPQIIDDHLRDLPGPAGVRLPGAADGFELAVRAVLGQRITVAAARTVAARLVGAFGSICATPWDDVQHLFPSAQRLARTSVERLSGLGMTRQQAQALHMLALRWPSLSACARDVCSGLCGPETLAQALQDIPGLGPWTAQYILMRWMDWPDAHLPADVAVLNALRLPRGPQGLRQAQDLLSTYQPWRSYAVVRLWRTLHTPPS